MTKLTINNQPIEVPDGLSVLQAARANGITIPTLCDHPDLTPYGGCRLCLVEVEKARGIAGLRPAGHRRHGSQHRERGAFPNRGARSWNFCSSSTHDSGYLDGQKEETQFMRTGYCAIRTGPGCRSAPRRPRTSRATRVDSDPNPFVWVDLNKCILCNRCVRACEEVQGRFVWGLAERGFDAHIAAGSDQPLLEARCESCGACVAYCPTGALDNKPSIGAGKPDKLVTTTCTYCGVGCQFDLNIKDGKIIRVTSNPNAPVNGMHLCVKGRYGYDFIHHPDRLIKPRVRRYLLERRAKQARSSHGRQPPRGWDWVETDWDTALEITAARLMAAIRDSTGRRYDRRADLGQVHQRRKLPDQQTGAQVIGTNNIDHCARL